MQPKELRAMMAANPIDAFHALDLLGRNEPGDRFSGEEMKAVQAVVAGRLAEGIGALVALEENFPGRYSTASNLGTAYELKGDNRKALQWISEGIRRNPESHDGTEWLHALILETKLKLEQDSGWLHSHRVLELEESRLTGRLDRTPIIEVDGQKFDAEGVWRALHHQLRERMLLVKPKDAIVADLLYTYSLVQAHLNTVEPALELALMSQEYGFAVPELLAAQEEQFRSAIFHRRIRLFTLWGGGIAIFLFAVVTAIRGDGFFGITYHRGARVGKSRSARAFPSCVHGGLTLESVRFSILISTPPEHETPLASARFVGPRGPCVRCGRRPSALARPGPAGRGPRRSTAERTDP